jgi:hypothetical protein
MLPGIVFALGGIICLAVGAKAALRLRRFEQGSEPVVATIVGINPPSDSNRDSVPLLSWRDSGGVDHSAAAPAFSFLFWVRKEPVQIGKQLDALWNSNVPGDIRPANNLVRWVPVIVPALVGTSLFTVAATLFKDLQSH